MADAKNYDRSINLAMRAEDLYQLALDLIETVEDFSLGDDPTSLSDGLQQLRIYNRCITKLAIRARAIRDHVEGRAAGREG